MLRPFGCGFFMKGMQMDLAIRNADIFRDGALRKGNVSVEGGALGFSGSCAGSVFDGSGLCVVPGLADVHVHLREPGFSYKETIATGSAAAARGGYCAVCSMPNLDPVPGTLAALREQLDIIERDAKIKVVPYGSITKGLKGEELSDMEALAPYVAAFTDDGKGVQDRAMMREAMLRAKALGKMIVAHCEDNSLLFGGYIHDGEYCRKNGHRGISSESEWRQIARDLELAAETGCSYHVCHVSARESVGLIREAKASGVDVTCETAPHYLLLDDSKLKEDGRFKMNPPIRGYWDREALLEGILDGTVDMIATDHAPHSAEEKSRGLEKSLFGIVGIETAFPLLYTELVTRDFIDLKKLIDLMRENPRRRFSLDVPFEEGRPANFAVFDLNALYEIDPADFLSKGRSTPFEGRQVLGECRLTVCGGRPAYIGRGFEELAEKEG